MMSARLAAQLTKQHRNLGIRDAVGASWNPWWIMIVSFVAYASTVFVLRAIGTEWNAQFLLAFPAFCITYLIFAERFIIAGSSTGIHLFTASRLGHAPREHLGHVDAVHIDIIESGLTVDRWVIGARELAIAKKHRQRVVDMVRNSSP